MGSIRIVSHREDIFEDRRQAAQMLVDQLTNYKDLKNLIVLGIPRGGVILADKIARALNAKLDIILTRKIRAPMNPELAVGAVSEDGKLYLNQRIVEAIGLSDEYIEKEKNYQLNEIHRRKEIYRAVLQKEPLNGKTVILTDDGVATGATMQAAIWAAIAEFPHKLILALPVAPPETLERLANDVDDTICLCAPSLFGAISQFYIDFEQVEDDQVIDVLKNYSRGKSS